MSEQDKKYYWLKLKRDFFKRHDIQIIEDMPNGKDYILFYVKLLCESVDHEGMLRFNEEIPYNEQMLATITNTNVDIVRSAVKVFAQLQMMEVLDDGTIYMREVQKMLGCETKWAEKKRQYRLKKEDNVLPMSTECPNDVRQEIEKDLELDLDLEKDLNKINLKKNQSINESDALKGMLAEIEVSPIAYKTFFENLQALGIQDNKLVLRANSISQSAIEEAYHDKVLEALKKIGLKGYIWRD